MAVVFDAQGTTNAASGATPVTSIDFTNLTVGTGSQRALVVPVLFSANVTSLTVTWDNTGTPQPCTLIGAASDTGAQIFAKLYGLVNPTPGAKTLHLAWTTTSDVYVDAVSYTGVDQTGGATS